MRAAAPAALVRRIQAGAEAEPGGAERVCQGNHRDIGREVGEPVLGVPSPHGVVGPPPFFEPRQDFRAHGLSDTVPPTGSGMTLKAPGVSVPDHVNPLQSWPGIVAVALSIVPLQLIAPMPIAEQVTSLEST